MATYEEARDFVHSILLESLKEVKDNDFPPVESKWLTVEDFTIETGQSFIEELIKSWNLDKSWLHYIRYSGLTEDYNLHCYNVVFSQPSRLKPVPRATVSDRLSPVKTFYVVESSRVILRPGVEEFKEIWLKNVIESKLAVVNQVKLSNE